ncbi:Calcineurin-like phosphoesterase [Dyadobacter sp. SG02]|uniref:metallophosphoesterase family protein n=1 Tax=Dyadobacter sp. SG02 TaxID=1855291 RepID=UPI0008D277D9|nr:metallophosphoesterase [Dyadobacter sp. SG02]SEJ38426.1 Calcineurin-like phosphoesterase [Dyadobacter sp. SG02]
MRRRLFLRAATLSPVSLAGIGSFVKPKELIRFGICTDLHYDLIPDGAERLTAFVDAMNRQKADFIIQLGDFCVPKPVNQPILDVWNKFSGPKYHVIGNHETDGGFTHAQVIDFWKARGAYYSFDANEYHFVVLNGNEKNPDGTQKGYPRYIGAAQREWLAQDLAKTKLPVIVFCHQGLDNDVAGIEQALAIRRIFEKANEQAGHLKVRIVFSGHHHQDYLNEINGIQYVQINSMSYFWAGEKRNTTQYSDDLVKKYGHLSSMLRYKDPLWATVTIFSDGRIEIGGTRSDFLDMSPSDVNLTEAESIYPVVSVVSKRHFSLPKV